MVLSLIKDFFKLEASSSIILVLAAFIAMLAANSPLLPYYNLLHTHDMTVAINDGLMALFFLVIGIEIKQEITSPKHLLLPFGAALGGIIVPALIFSAFNWNTEAANGWAIPSATDIAFSLGILSFFGKKIPPSLKLFLMMVAVIDDIAGVGIIAVFYSGQLSIPALAMTGFCILLLCIYNRYVTRAMPYLFMGAALWAAMLDSGIHAALSGAILGLLLPPSIGKSWLHKLHPWVAYAVVPVFAFANAGIPLAGLMPAHLTAPLPLGIIAGLFIGKQLGVFGVSAVMIRCRAATLPTGCGWRQFYAVCVLTGIGFTMSLFIGALAFEPTNMLLSVRIGVLAGSLFSAITGALLLALAPSYRGGEA